MKFRASCVITQGAAAISIKHISRYKTSCHRTYDHTQSAKPLFCELLFVSHMRMTLQRCKSEFADRCMHLLDSTCKGLVMQLSCKTHICLRLYWWLPSAQSIHRGQKSLDRNVENIFIFYNSITNIFSIYLLSEREGLLKTIFPAALQPSFTYS